MRMPETSGRARGWVLPATAGVASVAFGVGVGELAAAILAPSSSPFVVVGSFLIDLAPPWAKDAAISLFGTGDKAALLIGKAAEKIESELNGAVPLAACGTMAEAVGHARARAESGDVVLLAPACASFDQFKNFEHRGKVFKQLVAELI